MCISMSCLLARMNFPWERQRIPLPPFFTTQSCPAAGWVFPFSPSGWPAFVPSVHLQSCFPVAASAPYKHPVQTHFPAAASVSCKRSALKRFPVAALSSEHSVWFCSHLHFPAAAFHIHPVPSCYCSYCFGGQYSAFVQQPARYCLYLLIKNPVQMAFPRHMAAFHQDFPEYWHNRQVHMYYY